MTPVKDPYGLPPLKKPYGQPPRPEGDGLMRGIVWGLVVTVIAFVLMFALGVFA